MSTMRARPHHLEHIEHTIVVRIGVMEWGREVGGGGGRYGCFFSLRLLPLKGGPIQLANPRLTTATIIHLDGRKDPRERGQRAVGRLGIEGFLGGEAIFMPGDTRLGGEGGRRIRRGGI